MNRHEYDLVDVLREANAGQLRSHRAVTAVQATAGIAAPLVLARAARQREKTNLHKAREMPRWSVRLALRVFGDRYRDAVGMARTAVDSAGAAGERNHVAMRRALRFYGNLWRVSPPALA